MQRSSLVPGLCAIALWGLACSSSGEAAPAPVTATIGAFSLTVLPGTARLTVATSEGKELLGGLDASNDVGSPQSANDDAPPMTGFATREVATTYEMLYGSFRVVDDTRNPWRVARRARWDGTGAIAVLADDGSTLASLTPARGDDDAHLVVDIAPGDGPARRFSWGFRCAPEDRFMGFGEQTAFVDARKETIPIWVSEEGIGKDLTTDDPTGGWFLSGRRHSTSMPLPMFYARRGYIGVVESDRRSTFAMCSEREDVARFEMEMPAKLHLFAGPSPREAVGRYSARFGRPRVPPAFAFAPWNDALFGSANVRRVAKKLRDLGVPSSVIWTEDWRGGDAGANDGYTLKEEWDLDRSLYPDFESVSTELHGAGFKWLVYFNTFVDATAAIWKEAAPQHVIKGPDGQPRMFDNPKFHPSSMIDLTDPKAFDFVVAKLAGAIALGADGWMGDYGEWLPTDAKLANGEDAAAVHNRYPLLWLKAQRQALDAAQAKDGVERLSFVRSGWLGAAPLVDVFWPGDQRTDFQRDDGMPTVIPMGIGAGLGGMSTFGSDVGGYQSATNPPTSKELFFRWTELGAWSPVMRTHHGTQPKREWSWESDDETTQHWARYAKLHIALAPYLRGLADEAHRTGAPIVRALAFENPEDDASWSVTDAWLLGPGVLVAPVIADGARSREVVLPAGTWTPWTGGARVAGGARITADAPIGEIPVYVRGGAIVPMYPDGVMTLVNEPSSAPAGASVRDGRVVLVVAGARGAFAEAGGALAYTLESDAATSSSGAVQATWNGAALPTCQAAAPCEEDTPSGVRARVSGPGTLSVSRGGAPPTRFTATGGASDRSLVIDVRL